MTSQPYPTVTEVIEQMKAMDPARFDAKDDELIYEAICEWDIVLSHDPEWYDEEDTDLKDALRDEVQEELGWEEFCWAVRCMDCKKIFEYETGVHFLEDDYLCGECGEGIRGCCIECYKRDCLDEDGDSTCT